MNLNNGFGISKDAKDPVRIIKFLDALMDEKWQKLLPWGEEGVDYTSMRTASSTGRRSSASSRRIRLGSWRTERMRCYGAVPKMEGKYQRRQCDDRRAISRRNSSIAEAGGQGTADAYGYKTWTDFFSRLRRTRFIIRLGRST